VTIRTRACRRGPICPTRNPLTIDLARLPAELPSLAELESEFKRRQQNKLTRMFPDAGPLRRELYNQHTRFFAAGARYSERLFLAANRVGKTTAGAYETALHLTGLYPRWWPGRRFTKSILAWAGGDTSKTTRDIQQLELMGSPSELGTGMIPGALILDTKAKQGLPDGLEIVYVKHVSGKASRLLFKSYDQGRKSWQGTKPDLIWCDEEPPMDVWTEIQMRLMATAPGELGGIAYLTFTPIEGWTEVVSSFLKRGGDGKLDTKSVTYCDWGQVPHLSKSEIERMLATLPPYQLEARSKGIPSIGEGAIYPVSESLIKCEPFEVPRHWPRAFGLDVGWNMTAAIWRAHDRDTDTIYLYDEHRAEKAPPLIHAEAIKSRGEWIRGVIDPASFGRGQADGEQLIEIYRRLGLDLSPANNRVEPGLQEMYQRMSLGKLKVVSTLRGWWSEFPMYRRKNGLVVKQNDHSLDASRYAVVSGGDVQKTKVESTVSADSWMRGYGTPGAGWLG
jgi:phage terminase large subunit-like protein